MNAPATGHGDHWLAALPQGDPRLLDALGAPLDAPEGLKLHRTPLTSALDMVQVTRGRRLVTAYPEPRATALLRVRPRELAIWETEVEGWLTAEEPRAGALTFFLTDLAEHGARYTRAGGHGLALEAAGLAYDVGPLRSKPGPDRLAPAAARDPRFLPDDAWFQAEVRDVREGEEDHVLDLSFQGGLVLPVAVRGPARAGKGDRVEGFLWLTGRLPEPPA